MEEIKIKMDEKDIIDNVIKKAKNGVFIAILVKNEKEYKKLVNILKNYMSFKRGVFVKRRSLVVIFLYETFFNDINLFKNNFDIIFEMEN